MMAVLGAVLVVTSDPDEPWLRDVAARWATGGSTVTWCSPGFRALVAASGHDAVLLRAPGSQVLPWLAPAVHVLTERPTPGWRPRGSVVVPSPAERRALRANGLRCPIHVVPTGPAQRCAKLLAGVLVARAMARGHCRRRARPDLSTVVGFTAPATGLTLRATDEIWTDGEQAVALLHGCDEVDARIAMARQGITPTFARLATDDDLLLGPALIAG